VEKMSTLSPPTPSSFKEEKGKFIMYVFVFHRLHNEPGAHYESAGTRLFYLGRTDTIRSCSIESVHFAKTMLDPKSSNEDKKQALLAAVKGHKDYATQVK
jgi:carnitine O-acetyltransferase